MPDSDRRPVLVLDVNETMSDLAPLAGCLAELGVPGDLAGAVARGWFAGVLRDAFALSLAGARPVFAEVAHAAAVAELARVAPDGDPGAGAERLMAEVRGLGMHPDVAPGLRALREAGVRVVTLSNGGTALAERMLGEAGVRDCVEAVLSVEDAPAWKPAPAAYAHAATSCGVPVARMALVACHPWDLDGAIRAGMRGIWVDREAAAYPASFTSPTARVPSFEDLAEIVLGW